MGLGLPGEVGWARGAEWAGPAGRVGLGPPGVRIEPGVRMDQWSGSSQSLIPPRMPATLSTIVTDASTWPARTLELPPPT